MKRNIIICILCAIAMGANAQEFDKAITDAQSAYKAGKLEETHFALQQAMQELDMVIGKEVLKLLPPKMDTLARNAAEDNVTSNIGFVGATIHTSYGAGMRKADLSIISNSPMVAMLNSVLNTPLLGGMMADQNNKNVKVQGYKARLTKSEGSEPGKTKYELMVPLGSSLITFNAGDCSESQVLAMANTLPLQQIAKLIQ